MKIGGAKHEPKLFRSFRKYGGRAAFVGDRPDDAVSAAYFLFIFGGDIKWV